MKFEDIQVGQRIKVERTMEGSKGSFYTNGYEGVVSAKSDDGRRITISGMGNVYNDAVAKVPWTVTLIKDAVRPDGYYIAVAKESGKRGSVYYSKDGKWNNNPDADRFYSTEAWLGAGTEFTFERLYQH